MTFLTILDTFNYGLVLIFGVLLSVEFSGGWKDPREKRMAVIFCAALLLIQSSCWLLFGTEIVEQIYPLIIHLPLLLVLIFLLKTPVSLSLVSVCTAYLCCQLPHWIDMTFSALTRSALVGEISYFFAIIIFYFLLHHFFVRAVHSAVTASSYSFLIFGSLPIAYYLFDYITTVYFNALSVDVRIFNEFLPTVLITFYVIFLTAYYWQAQERAKTQLQNSMLEAALKQSKLEMDGLRQAETQALIYQHDIRHHLAMIETFLAAGKPQQAEEYIQKVDAEVKAIIPIRFTQNETLNLLCSSFSARAKKQNTQLSIQADLPQSLPFPDTELCSMISNGLENALHAVAVLPESERKISFFCGIRHNRLLIEIKNPYAGQVTMSNGIPVSAQPSHGFGCRSICAIAQQHHGHYLFEAEGGRFTLRVMLPL